MHAVFPNNALLVIFLTQCSLNLFYLIYTATPTRTTRNSKTLINNIYYVEPLNISGNLHNIISDHLIQFLIELLDFAEKSSKMINRQRCYKNFDKIKFTADLVKVNWDGLK